MPDSPSTQGKESGCLSQPLGLLHLPEGLAVSPAEPPFD